MTVRNKAFIVGAYEHPGRVMPDKSLFQIHAEVVAGALKDAGLGLHDVDGFFVTSNGPTPGTALADYLGLRNLRMVDGTVVGGSSPVFQLGHAAMAIASGRVNVALVTLANRSRTDGGRPAGTNPEMAFEDVYGTSTLGMYALAAKRHMYEFGTTSEQMAWVKVAASRHAQYNPHAMLKKVVTVEDVLNSPMLSDPLHRLDSCVVTDGGGAVIMVSPEIAKSLGKTRVKLLGQAEAPKHTDIGRLELTYTGAKWTGPRAFEEAGVKPSEVKYASIYDSFTITVIETLEDLGFCEKGQGGNFVDKGALEVGKGPLAINTDGGGLCNNHPGMGGMMKILEAVRQLRGDASPETQIKDLDLAVVHGTGGSLGTRMASATMILGSEDR